MQTFNDVHQQFAEFFKSETLKPFAYLVSRRLSEGHICLDLRDVQEELINNAFYYDYEPAKVARLPDDPFVTSKMDEKKPFVLHNHKLYLQRYFNYETQILERIREFAENEKLTLQSAIINIERHADFIRPLFLKTPGSFQDSYVENVNWQLVAAVNGVLNDFTIITGGPGTGKTTTVAKILSILYTINPNLKVALAAPTGKAAARMGESLKSASLNVPKKIKEKFETILPGTIHRLLKYVPDSPYFKFDKDNPVNYDVVIIDESSMIDAALFAKLLNAIGPKTKLILLGDKDQLASVEAGSLFGDLCKAQQSFKMSAERARLMNALIVDTSHQIIPDLITDNIDHILFEHIVELRKSHRFSSDKGIGKFSKAVISGNTEEIKIFLQKEDEQVCMDTAYDEKIFDEFIKKYKEYIKEPDIRKALNKLNSLRVLCAVREGEHGLYAINRRIEKYLQQYKLIKPSVEFYEHRPILITKNYYALNLFNGDVGIIRYDENNVLKAWFEDSSGELKSIPPGFVSEVETVYAMTIHKSQGSEFDEVLVVLPDADIPLLTSELLYTGVTRAKAKVTVQASENVLIETSKRRVKRASGIMERFQELELPGGS